MNILKTISRLESEREAFKADFEATKAKASDLVGALENIRVCLYYSRKPANEILKEIDDLSYTALAAYKGGK